MNTQDIFQELGDLRDVVRLTLSAPRPECSGDEKSLSLRPVEVRGERAWQFESRRGAQVFHENTSVQGALERLGTVLENFRQICVVRPGETVTYSHYGKKVKRSVAPNTITRSAASHDRGKSYLLPEGEPVPALVDLGIFTPEYKLVRSMSDKYKQINRFLELIEDNLRFYSGESIRILDFGCGKSYLTFILYYYLVEKRGLDAEIVGYDLKADVVEHCNRIAEKYGYSRLRFLCADVSRDTQDADNVDMLVTLHACDTATDYALDYAIRNAVPYVFSVPCCQHEVNLSIHRGGDLDIFMRHGLLRERMSALLTDAMRAEILRACGYEVDVIEFVDLSHTPKNLMLRARLRRRDAQPDLSALSALQERYGFDQTLLHLTTGRAHKPSSAPARLK